MSNSAYLDRPGAADYINAKGLPTTAGTLRKYATVGGGPKFRKFGRNVVYDPADLDAWIASRLSHPVVRTKELDACNAENSRSNGAII